MAENNNIDPAALNYGNAALYGVTSDIADETPGIKGGLDRISKLLTQGTSKTVGSSGSPMGVARAYLDSIVSGKGFGTAYSAELASQQKAQGDPLKAMDRMIKLMQLESLEQNRKIKRAKWGPVKLHKESGKYYQEHPTTKERKWLAPVTEKTPSYTHIGAATNVVANGKVHPAYWDKKVKKYIDTDTGEALEGAQPITQTAFDKSRINSIAEKMVKGKTVSSDERRLYSRWYSKEQEEKRFYDKATEQWYFITPKPPDPKLFPAPGTVSVSTEEPAKKEPTKEVETKRTVKPVLSGGVKNRVKEIYGMLGDVTKLLKEAEKAGETITGVPGWTKAVGGGYARQIGLPVSDRAEALSKKMIALSLALGPIITKEKSRISNEERALVNKIAGGVSPGQDYVSVRTSLIGIVKMLQKIETGE